MRNTANLRPVGRTVLRRSQKLLAGLWVKSSAPYFVGRLESGAKMADAGAVSLVIQSAVRSQTPWALVPFESFGRKGQVPAVTDQTRWHATENGKAVPHSLETVLAVELERWKESMSRVHLRSTSEDE